MENKESNIINKKYEKNTKEVNEIKENNISIKSAEKISEDNNKKNENSKNENDNKYILKIKKYLSVTTQNEEYKNKLKSNPEQIFQFLTEEIFILWQNIITNSNSMPTIISSDDKIIALIPNRKDQELIAIDAKRTRFFENKLIPGFSKILEMVLTFYCNIKEIKYKQGLNELFGPLILILYKLKRLKLKNIFNFGEAFIDKFLPNYFYENGLFSLKSSISIYGLLLKYHEPSIYKFLDNLEIAHELYSTNWLLNLRSGKLNLDILYYFFDNLIKINDPLFIHFILVAIIIYHRELLINCEPNLLVKLLNELTINSKEELDDIIKLALEIRKNTPYSLRILVNRIGFLKLNNKDISYAFKKYNPTSLKAMPVCALEILYENNKKQIICPDPDCKNSRKNKSIIKIDWDNDSLLYYKKSKIENSNHICEKCNMNVNKDLNYILLDLRVFPPSYSNEEYDYFKLGFISGIMAIDNEQLEINDITPNFMGLRGKNHIVLMTSNTDYFNKFEEKFYSDNTSNAEKRKKMFGIIQAHKNEKILNLSDAGDLDLEEIYKLKEYDNLRKVMNSMKNKNFPYVSYLAGGFEALHNDCLKYKIELVGHDKKKCIICKKNNNLNNKNKRINSQKEISCLWKNQKVIKKHQFDKFFFDDKNRVFFCSLRQYKNKFYHNNNLEVFVAIRFDIYSIEIYKKDIIKENYIYDSSEVHNQKNPNYYNLGMKIEDNNNLELKLIEEIEINNLIKVFVNQENKQNIIIEFKNKEKDKKQEKYLIELNFYSLDDSKLFMKSVKNLDY